MGSSQFRVGETFHHVQLGECQIREVHSDGSLTVCTVEVKRSLGTNIFRLRRPINPGLWSYSLESRGGY